MVDATTLTKDTVIPEFAGLASMDPPNHAHIEEEEYEGWITFEESTASVDWKTNLRPVDESAYSTIAPLQQSKSTPIVSLDEFPFYLDSGATVHISPDKTDFLTLHAIPPRVIKGVGSATINALGIGSVRLRISRGSYLTLENVLYIPNSTVRLLSVQCLAKDSNVIAHFSAETCWLTNRSTNALVANGSLVSGKKLYTLALYSPLAAHAYSAQHTVDLETWHRRLGHANYQALQDMARNGLVAGMPASFPSLPPKCESCILGKQTKTPVPKVRAEGRKATRKLEIVWVDLQGPNAVTSRTGNRYVMNLVDDYTTMPWTIPLKKKSDAYSELKAWERAREEETGLKVGIYRTGNDGELNSEKMEEWLKEHGTQQQFGAPNTSQHMGRVERMHRTLMSKARM
ncbi:hypothetical protein Hypma_009671 [Hypsizygus marmoreus]|uniref:Integrase catalytic domain-containing protein n=1 Tax=Hypsizygus marmoreus TaxID=39966 RepID=A0A369JMT5_HYPMA|nr:hypothetical protein Hypma_009671 [Hypsizygus marmoreus]